jgi:hypothetical protein
MFLMSHKHALDSLFLRPVLKEEVSLWNRYMDEFHYLGLKWLGGKSVRYVAFLEGNWAALLGWCSASKNCGVRDSYIGWSGEKKYKRLKYIVNNARFLVLPWINQKNFASKVLSHNLKRLSLDFEQIYGHPVYLAETFVDESRYKGTCYKASNWKHVGYTKGYSRSNNSYYHHGNAKAVYVYSLCKKACEVLSGALIPYDFSLSKSKRRLEKMIKFPIETLLSKIREFITDPRSNHGKRYPLETVLSIAVCAVLCGCRGYRAIGAWSASLSGEELIRFGSKRKSPPSESAIRRVIQRVDTDEFDRQIGQWLLEQKLLAGCDHLNGRALAIDGKTLRGSHDGAKKKAIHLLGAVIHKEGVVVAQEEVGEKTNEIKHVKPLLNHLDIEGYVVTADAMHTQKELANYLVEEKKTHYLFTAKANQPALLEDIKFVDLKKTAKPNLMLSPTTKDTDG